MLGVSALSSTPFAAVGGGVNFDSELTENSSVVGVTSVTPTFLSVTSESNTASESAQVVASVFNAVYSETGNVSDAIIALFTVLSSVDENTQLTDVASSAATFPVTFEDASSAIDLAAAAIDFSCAINEAGQGNEVVSALVALITSVLESGSASELTAATISYPASIGESVSGTDGSGAAAAFSPLVSESVSGTEATNVAPSVFNASVAEDLLAAEQFFAAVVFIANTADGAAVADQLLGRFLWELVDTAQAAEWTQVNASQSVTWGVVPTKT